MTDPLRDRAVPPLDQVTAARLRREIRRRGAPILARFGRPWPDEMAAWARVAIPAAFSAGVALVWTLGKLAQVQHSPSGEDASFVRAVATGLHPAQAVNVAFGPDDVSWVVEHLVVDDEDEPPRRPWISVRATVLVVLLVHTGLGVLAGIAVDRLFLHRPHGGPPSDRHFGFRNEPGRPPRGPFGGGGPMPRQMVERLGRELDLTEVQRTRIEAVLTDQMTRFRTLREEYAPRMRRLFDEGQTALDSLLTPEQRARFHELRRRTWFELPAEGSSREFSVPPDSG